MPGATGLTGALRVRHWTWKVENRKYMPSAN